MSQFKKSLIIVFLVILVDQILKFYIKTSMVIGEQNNILGEWFIIRFIENNGMAFGLEFGGEFGKVILSLFRIVVVIGIGFVIYYMTRDKAIEKYASLTDEEQNLGNKLKISIYRLSAEKYPIGFIVCMSLIFAGAIGNIIDSTFYGILFNNSFHEVATLFPEESYSSLLHGRVVDMLYFPIIDGTFPNWMPGWGGEEFVFFRPIFNIADSSITVGVAIILLFQRKFFKKEIES